MTTNYTKNFGLAMPDFRTGPWHDLLNGTIAQIDAIVYGALSNVQTPTWANNTFYDVGITTFDSQSATTWMCNVAHTTPTTGTFANERAAHPTYWVQLLAGFAPRGQWANNTQYFPYDLVYDTTLGIMALCKTLHTSTPSGNINTDKAFWAYLIDMSASTLSTAVAVTYSNGGSGIPSTNVQAAIDYLQSEIVAVNNVNVSQGTSIGNLQTSDGTQNTTLASYGSRLTAIETTNTNQDNTLSSYGTRITNLENALAAGTTFPVGTKLLFYQQNAPTGWTKVTTDNDKILRVVNGTTGGTAGGTNPFTVVNAQTTVGNHTITTAELASHTHPYTGQNPPWLNYYQGGSQGAEQAGRTTSSTGSDNSHNHTITMNIQYCDVIVASKN